jgi:hypothetical protein
MTWASILAAIASAISSIGKIVTGFFGWRESKVHEELGELREKNRQHEANSDILDAIADADVNSVSDDEITR